MERDWREWHRGLRRSRQSRAGAAAARRAAAASATRSTRLPPGPIRVISVCAGEGRDLLGVLADHPRAADVTGRLVELDPELAATAAAHAPPGVEVVCGDASTTSAYAGAVPADLVLVCGVFGNVSDDDIERHGALAADAVRAGRDRRSGPATGARPTCTVDVRRWFAEAGFEEVAFVGSDDFLFGVGAHRLRGRRRSRSTPDVPPVHLRRPLNDDASTQRDLQGADEVRTSRRLVRFGGSAWWTDHAR